MSLRQEILNHMTMEEYIELRERLSEDISIMILKNKPEEWDLEPSYKIIKDGQITTRGDSGDYETQEIVMYEKDVIANLEDKDVFDEILYHFMDQDVTNENTGNPNENFGKIDYDKNDLYIYYNIVSFYGEYTGQMYYGYTGTEGEDGNIDEGLGFDQCTDGEFAAMDEAGNGEDYDDSLCIPHSINYVIYINNFNGTGFFVFEDPDNVGAFLEITREKQNIDPEKAKSILDTTIVELIPSEVTRQQYINRFFNDYAILKGSVPEWIYDNLSNASAPEDYSIGHDISNTSGDESDKYITRLKKDEDTDNINKSLEWLRDDITSYLEDLNFNSPNLQDQRPEYTNKQDGYLSIRNMNQAVIVRKAESDQSDLFNIVDISGTDLSYEWNGASEAPSYLGDGFTISMWVRFLDKVSSGTLFNFGNPIREVNPFGIRLETYVIDNDNNQIAADNDDGTYDDVINSTNPNGALFLNDHYERFIRLVVRELPSPTLPRGKIRSSWVGSQYYGRSSNTGYPTLGYPGDSEGIPPNNSDLDQFSNSLGMFNSVKVPHNLDEWYFIVASYDPLVDEDSALLPSDPNYWMRHTVNGTDLVHDTREGLRCKVEIISRTDLLRARGYKI